MLCAHLWLPDGSLGLPAGSWVSGWTPVGSELPRPPTAAPQGPRAPADKLGLERLLSSIVRPYVKNIWERGRS